MDQLTDGRMDKIPSLCCGFQIYGWATCVPNLEKIDRKLWALDWDNQTKFFGYTDGQTDGQRTISFWESVGITYRNLWLKFGFDWIIIFGSRFGGGSRWTNWRMDQWTKYLHFLQASGVWAELSLCQIWRRLVENCELQSGPNVSAGLTDRRMDREL